MARLVKPLTDAKCAAAKAQDKEYSLFDGDGLILLIRKSGKKTWRYKYKRGRSNPVITMGDYPALTLVQARDKRREYESLLAQGLDPKEELEKQKAKETNVNTLENIGRKWLDAYAVKKPLSDDTKHKKLRKLENHLFPKFENVAMGRITLEGLRGALNIIYDHSPDNAQRIRADLVLIFGYARQHNHIDVNIARELDDMDLSKVEKHRATFKAGQLNRIPSLIQSIKQDGGHPLTKLCLLLALHTFLRSSEIRFSRWTEIDFNKKEWVIPATRELSEGCKHSDRGAKMRINHTVPLSRQVMGLLEQVYEYSSGSPFVFPSPSDQNKFISENTPVKALRRMGYDKEEMSFHGFRAIARSALAEMSLFAREVLEKQMSHKESDNTVDAYTHIAEYMDERKKVMQVWSDWLERIEMGDYISPYDYGLLMKQSSEVNTIEFNKSA